MEFIAGDCMRFSEKLELFPAPSSSNENKIQRISVPRVEQHVLSKCEVNLYRCTLKCFTGSFTKGFENSTNPNFSHLWLLIVHKVARYVYDWKV